MGIHTGEVHDAQPARRFLGPPSSYTVHLSVTLAYSCPFRTIVHNKNLAGEVTGDGLGYILNACLKLPALNILVIALKVYRFPSLDDQRKRNDLMVQILILLMPYNDRFQSSRCPALSRQ